MIVPGSLKRRYDFVQPHVAEVGQRVRDVVLGFCESRGFASLWRIKSAESLAEKVETGRYSRWAEVDDLFACSIIVPSVGDEPDVLQFLEHQFVTSTVRRRGTTLKDPAIFRFDATRFIGRLQPRSGLAGDLHQISFEVQVRTAFEHAWAVATHPLVYKGRVVDWRNARLAAQMKALVEQLDQLVAKPTQAVEAISLQSWPDVAARDEIVRGFLQFESEGLLPPECLPASWVRFSENLLGFLKAAAVRGARKPEPAGLVRAHLPLVRRELEESKSEGYPLSLSLMQFCIGSYTKHHGVPQRLDRYHPFVTDEVRNFFPLVAKLPEVFDLEE